MARVSDPTGTERPEDLRVEQHDRVIGPDGDRLTLARSVATDPLLNPLGEDIIRVRVRDGVEFFPAVKEGEKATGGEELDMPISQARAASMLVDEILPGGKLRPVPHEQQRIVGLTPLKLSGRPRHERIGELEAREKELNIALDDVRKRLDHERGEVEREQREKAEARPPEATEGDRPGEGGPVQTPPPPGTPGGAPVPPTGDQPNPAGVNPVPGKQGSTSAAAGSRAGDVPGLDQNLTPGR